MDSLLIEKYFKDLSQEQKEKYLALGSLYQEWNQKINVISRADIDSLYLKHILHSMAIAHLDLLKDSQNILDVGTGGGFPGIPLAIFYPEKQFTLIDSIGKKILVVENIAKALGLKNVTAIKTKSTMLNQKFDTITGRAVTAFPNFFSQVKDNLQNNAKIVYLKGGDFLEELEGFDYKLFEINQFFTEEFFETKKIIEVKWVG